MGYTKVCNHPQPPTTIRHQLPKHPKTYHKQLCYCILDINTETDADFGTDMKHCIYIYIYIYIYIHACLCVCTL